MSAALRHGEVAAFAAGQRQVRMSSSAVSRGLGLRGGREGHDACRSSVVHSELTCGDEASSTPSADGSRIVDGWVDGQRCPTPRSEGKRQSTCRTRAEALPLCVSGDEHVQPEATFLLPGLHVAHRTRPVTDQVRDNVWRTSSGVLRQHLVQWDHASSPEAIDRGGTRPLAQQLCVTVARQPQRQVWIGNDTARKVERARHRSTLFVTTAGSTRSGAQSPCSTRRAAAARSSVKGRSRLSSPKTAVHRSNTS